MTNESLIKIWRDLCAEESRLQSEIATIQERLNQVKAELQTVLNAKSELEQRLPKKFSIAKACGDLFRGIQKVCASQWLFC